MKATFRICDSTSVEVETNGLGGYVAMRHVHYPDPPPMPPPNGVPGSEPEPTTYSTILTKAEARAVASALMGCAAEL